MKAIILACAACGSANPNMDHSSMVDGMNLAILTLGAILLPVLGTFLALLIYVIRKSEAVEAANVGQASPLPASARSADFKSAVSRISNPPDAAAAVH